MFKKILYELQKGIPITKRPFLELSRKLGISEEHVLTVLKEAKEKGFVRRFGGVFNSEKMGKKGILCAMKVPEERIEEVASIINSFGEVTHNYERDNEINIWFTITGDPERVDKVIGEIEKKTGIEVLRFPSLKTFKISLVLPTYEDE